MIQEIEPEIFDNQYRNLAPTGGDTVFCFCSEKVLLHVSGDGGPFPDYDAVVKAAENDRYTYLFSIDEQRFFLYFSQNELSIEGFEYAPAAASIRALPERRNAMAAATALHLYRWYRDNRWCGRCGTPTVHDSVERMMRCPRCGNMIFPKLCPAVIVGVINGDSILLTARIGGRGHFALVSGFTEIGESAEQTVIREVLEETGIRVENPRYYTSQPWGFSGDLLTGFYVDALNTDISIDPGELVSAKWFRRDEIPEMNTGLSLTENMIMRFKHHPELF